MSLAYVQGSEYPTKDGEYWTMSERIHTIYDSQVYVPIYKRPIGHLFYYIGKYAGRLKNYQVTYRIKNLSVFHVQTHRPLLCVEESYRLGNV